MAVKEANSIYKSFTFNGISAADYGVYVTDVNVFNSAERAVEYITIPGRNGSFALDHGRFENITVVYDCALGQDTDVDFVTAISDFRNALASAKGYQRLEDDMNPDEYRMAVFSKGLEAPTLNQQTAKFKVEFNCKPQRYLKSGETAIELMNEAVLTNPTMFPASPILKLRGYGIFKVGDYDYITIENKEIGIVSLAPQRTASGSTVVSNLANTGNMNTGDTITVASGSTISVQTNGGRDYALEGVGAATFAGDIGGSATASYVYDASTRLFVANVDVTLGAVEFEKGTQATKNFTVSFNARYGGTAAVTETVTLSFTISYAPSTQKISIACTGVSSTEGAADIHTYNSCSCASVTGYSTKPAITETICIDLDIGEAYLESGTAQVNSLVQIGAELPTLVPGDTKFLYSPTITHAEIIPRWWKV